MIILLHGEDTFRSSQKLKELIESYQKKHEGGFSFERIDAQDISFKELKNALTSTSLFDDSKCIVLEDALKNKQLKKELSEWEGLPAFAKESNNLLLLFEEKSIEKDKEYKSILKHTTKSQDFKKLSPAEAVKWFTKYFQKENKEFDATVMRLIVHAADGDMWRAYNNLRKVYSYNKGGKLNPKEVSLLKLTSEEVHIFPTLDAIFLGNLDKAIYDIQIHWREEEEHFPQQFFYMLERQIKLITLVKEQKEKGATQQEISKKLSQHPFVIKKTLSLCDKYSWAKIKDLYSRIESIEVKNKTGQMDARFACELLSAAIAR